MSCCATQLVLIDFCIFSIHLIAASPNFLSLSLSLLSLSPLSLSLALSRANKRFCFASLKKEVKMEWKYHVPVVHKCYIIIIY